MKEGEYTEQELIEISETAYIQTAVAMGSGDATVIGTTLENGKTRYVWYILATSNDGSEQGLQIFNGDTTDQDRTTLAITRVTDNALVKPLELGGNPKTPILSFARTSAQAAVPVNAQLRLAHETSAIDVTVRYYDLP